MGSTLDLLKRLNDCSASFALVGGMAAVVHGSQLVTADLDLCAPLDDVNLPRILSALKGLHPKFRMSPGRPGIPLDYRELAGFRNLYLDTDLGQLDVRSEISGVGAYEEVIRHTVTLDLGGVECLVLDLPALIRSKKALGRQRDIQAAIELEAILKRIEP